MMTLRDASDLAWPVLSSGTHTTQECKHTQCDTEQDQYLKWASRPNPAAKWSPVAPWRRWARKELWGWKSSRAFVSGSWWWTWRPRTARGNTRTRWCSSFRASLQHTQSNVQPTHLPPLRSSTTHLSSTTLRSWWSPTDRHPFPNWAPSRAAENSYM